MRYREKKKKNKEKQIREQNRYQQSYFGTNDENDKDVHSSKVRIQPWYRLPKMTVIPWVTVSFGVFFVTFLSPAPANYSLFEISLALSISLTSITPLFTIPLGIFITREKDQLCAVMLVHFYLSWVS
jgi:hypothetical protein